MDSPSKQSFFSIKWKAALLFGTMLLLFNTLFPLLVYWNLQQKFELSRAETQRGFQQELIGQLKSSSEHIQRVVEISLIPDDGSAQGVIALLDKHQLKLELEWHTTQAQLFDKSGRKIGGWGDTIPLSIQTLLSDTLRDEQPHTIVDCSQACKQFDLIPILNQGHAKHTLILAYNLSNTLLDFANKTAADVAVLSQNTTGFFSKSQLLTNWNMSLSALTSYSQNRPYLQTLSERYSFEAISQKSGIFRDSDLPVEFNILPLEGNDNTVFIIIDNIAKQQQEIIDLTIRNIVIALLGVLIIGYGLFIFLSKPLTRLLTVSQALPLLAKQQYNHVRELIDIEQTSRQADELDQLESSTYTLTAQLEQLHDSIKERTDALHSRSVELVQERDFVKSLIDTAQLIIITIDRQCKITSFNDFAEEITGYFEKDILNSPMSRFFPMAQWPEIEQSLIELKNNPKTVSQQESEFIHSDGSLRIVSWLHSSLEHPTDSSVVLSVGQDITDKKHSEQKIIWLAEHDVLTELFNRYKFTLEFEKILRQAQQSQQQGVLLFIDLDQFKDLNDSYGHNAGDQVLKQVAHLITSLTRENDVIARLGGDEFAIIYKDMQANDAIQLASDFSEQLALLDIILNNVPYKVTGSIGIVEYPLSDSSVQELISNADLAMNQAKSRGKNTWHQFNLDDQTRSKLETRVLWKRKIDDALENHRFVFYYQPIMDIRSQTVSHYEVLLRMVDEDGTINPPATFIEVAEQTGQIQAIDHFVLQQGILKQAELDKGDQTIALSLNLSGYAVDDKLLLPLLKRLLNDSNANPEHLIFELTETAAVADITQAKEFMLKMNELGCRFSLDDFGTGFASFRYMRELPVDIVKIDGSFITELVHNPDDQLFVKALVDVAKGMGKKTIAEFVENAETLALLHAFGVDYAQGYYIGKPEPYFLAGPPDFKQG